MIIGNLAFTKLFVPIVDRNGRRVESVHFTTYNALPFHNLQCAPISQPTMHSHFTTYNALPFYNLQYTPISQPAAVQPGVCAGHLLTHRSLASDNMLVVNRKVGRRIRLC